MPPGGSGVNRRVSSRGEVSAFPRPARLQGVLACFGSPCCNAIMVAVDRLHSPPVLSPPLFANGPSDWRLQMSQLDQAVDRLNAALDRLERAAQARMDQRYSADDAGAPADAQLRAELDAVRTENDTLRQANADAGQRLDKAIERLHAVLGA